jgi:hypothetical protein
MKVLVNQIGRALYLLPLDLLMVKQIELGNLGCDIHWFIIHPYYAPALVTSSAQTVICAS